MLCVIVRTSDCESMHLLWWEARDVRFLVPRRLVPNMRTDGGPGTRLMVSQHSSDPFTTDETQSIHDCPGHTLLGAKCFVVPIGK